MNHNPRFSIQLKTVKIVENTQFSDKPGNNYTIIINAGDQNISSIVYNSTVENEILNFQNFSTSNKSFNVYNENTSLSQRQTCQNVSTNNKNFSVFNLSGISKDVIDFHFRDNENVT